MPAGQLWFESHPQVCSRATSLLVGQVAQTFHCGFMHRLCHQPIDRAIRLDLPVGEDRLHTGTPGLTGAQMIDYKLTATSLKAKQGLWPLIGASCSLLRSHEKKEDKTKERKSEDDCCCRGQFRIIKTHPRLLLSLIHSCCSVSSNHTFVHIWPSSSWSSRDVKKKGWAWLP